MSKDIVQVGTLFRGRTTEQVEIVKSAGEAVEAEQNIKPTDLFALDPEILEVAKNFPEAALLQSFKQLENVILRIRDKLPDDKPHRNLNEVLQQLNEKKYVSANVIVLFKQLRKATNVATYGKDEHELSPNEALELIRQIWLLKDLLERIFQQLPRPSKRV